jgi:hypothetical protein
MMSSDISVLRISGAVVDLFTGHARSRRNVFAPIVHGVEVLGANTVSLQRLFCKWELPIDVITSFERIFGQLDGNGT